MNIDDSVDWYVDSNVGRGVNGGVEIDVHNEVRSSDNEGVGL